MALWLLILAQLNDIALCSKSVQSFGDLTQVYWQWVTNQVNREIITRYNGSKQIGNVLWTTSPLDSFTQFMVLKSVYFTDLSQINSNLQLDIIHVNTEWNQALSANFAIWPNDITSNWYQLYPEMILKHNIYKSTINNDYIFTNETQDISKPDWIDFPVLFYNMDLLNIVGIDIDEIQTWQDLFEVAYSLQKGKYMFNNPLISLHRMCCMKYRKTRVRICQFMGIFILVISGRHNLCRIGIYRIL